MWKKINNDSAVVASHMLEEVVHDTWILNTSYFVWILSQYLKD